MEPIRAPIRNVLLQTGERVPLIEYYETKPFALVFLRHLGCIFCREQVALLRGYPAVNVAFACLANPEEAFTFKTSMDSPQDYFCEPEGDLYRDFGLGNGNVVQLAGPRVILRGAQATLRGGVNRRPTANPRMLGGAFVIATSGDVVWSHPAKDAADIVQPEQIVRELDQAVSAIGR